MMPISLTRSLTLITGTPSIGDKNGTCLTSSAATLVLLLNDLDGRSGDFQSTGRVQP
jgi:hypothetical protein